MVRGDVVGGGGQVGGGADGVGVDSPPQGGGEEGGEEEADFLAVGAGAQLSAGGVVRGVDELEEGAV